MNKTLFGWAGISSIAFLALLMSSCGRTDPVEAHAPGSDDALTVVVAKAQVADLSHELALTAEFKPYREITVMAKVAGYVKQIYVNVGDRVQKDQLLATLEMPELADALARAQAALDRAKADVELARDEQRRAELAHEIAHLSYESLSQMSEQKSGRVARQEIGDARSKDLVAEAQVSAAKSALAAANQQVDVNNAGMARVKALIDYTRVTAPFAGVITHRFADRGSVIQAGISSQTQAMRLVKLSENSLLRLTLPVPESAVPDVYIGQQLEVNVPTLKHSFPGRVARFAEKLDLATRTMDTEVDVPNPSLVLVPGMYAKVNLTLSRENHVLAVPVAAVDVGSADDSTDAAPGAADPFGTVMVVNRDNRIEIRKVKLGLETADHVAIRAGLEEGDLVVIGNRGGLEAGQRVRPKVTTTDQVKAQRASET